MFCTKCGASFQKGTNFCPKCGEGANVLTNMAAKVAPAAVSAPRKKGSAWGALVALALILVVGILGSYAAFAVSGRERFDLIVLMIQIFEVLAGLFIVVTAVPIIFIGFKKYVLPKLRHSGAKRFRFLSALSRKFSWRK
jgi:hypothetical protein